MPFVLFDGFVVVVAIFIRKISSFYGFETSTPPPFVEIWMHSGIKKCKHFVVIVVLYLFSSC